MGFLVKNQRKPKKFGVEPRIYDARKAELDAMMKDKSEIEIFQENKFMYRERLRTRTGRYEPGSSSSMGRNFKIIVLFSILATAVGIVALSVYVMQLFASPAN